LFLDVPLTHAYRIIQIGLIVLLIVGLFVRSYRLHLWLICSILVIFSIGQAVFRLLPGLA
jgi:FtsH-binding integral membrane protein